MLFWQLAKLIVTYDSMYVQYIYDRYVSVIPIVHPGGLPTAQPLNCHPASEQRYEKTSNHCIYEVY